MALHTTSDIRLHFAGCSQLTCIYSRWMKINMHCSVCLCVFWWRLLYWYYSRWFSSTKLQASTQNPTHSLTTTRTVRGIHGFYSSWLHTLALGGKYFPFSCEVKGARGNSAKGFLCRGPGEGQHDWVSHSINIVILSYNSFRREYNAVSKSIDDLDPFLNLAPNDFAIDIADQIVKKSKHEAISRELRLINGQLERAMHVVDNIEQLLGITPWWQ